MNAYSNSPICTPSRSAFWSGKMVHRTESWNNFEGLGNRRNLQDLLVSEGYDVKLFGKTDFRGGGHTESNKVEAWTRDVPGLLLAQEGRPIVELSNSSKIQTQDWKDTVKIKNWLVDAKHRDPSKPFALYFGIRSPHPYRSPEMGKNFGGSKFKTNFKFLSTVDQKRIDVPASWRVPQHPVDVYSTFTKNCSSEFSDKEIKDVRAYYLAMCAETDDIFAEVMKSLPENYRKNTVILFTADHGEMAMEHRQFYKMSMFESSVHVPFFLKMPEDLIKTKVVGSVSGGSQIKLR